VADGQVTNVSNNYCSAINCQNGGLKLSLAFPLTCFCGTFRG